MQYPEIKLYEYKVGNTLYKFEYHTWLCDISNQTLHSVEQTHPPTSIIFDTTTSNHECMRQVFNYIKDLEN